jgi:hypothetical protein
MSAGQRFFSHRESLQAAESRFGLSLRQWPRLHHRQVDIYLLLLIAIVGFTQLEATRITII